MKTFDYAAYTAVYRKERLRTDQGLNLSLTVATSKTHREHEYKCSSRASKTTINGEYFTRYFKRYFATISRGKGITLAVRKCPRKANLDAGQEHMSNLRCTYCGRTNLIAGFK